MAGRTTVQSFNAMSCDPHTEPRILDEDAARAIHAALDQLEARLKMIPEVMYLRPHLIDLIVELRHSINTLCQQSR